MILDVSCLFPFVKVDNINAAVMDLKEKIHILSEEAKIGAHGKPVIFLLLGTMVESLWNWNKPDE